MITMKKMDRGTKKKEKKNKKSWKWKNVKRGNLFQSEHNSSFLSGCDIFSVVFCCLGMKKKRNEKGLNWKKRVGVGWRLPKERWKKNSLCILYLLQFFSFAIQQFFFQVARHEDGVITMKDSLRWMNANESSTQSSTLSLSLFRSL